MATSGEYQSRIDLVIDCACSVDPIRCEGIDDAADRTIWWTCPECGHPGNETYGDDLD